MDSITASAAGSAEGLGRGKGDDAGDHSNGPTHGDHQGHERLTPLQRTDRSTALSSSQKPSHLPLHLTNNQNHPLTRQHLHSTQQYHHHTTPNHNWSPQAQAHEHIHRRLFESNHISFLEDIARQECRNLSISSDAAENNDEDDRNEDRRRFLFLDFASDDDDISDSEDELSTSDDDEDTDELQEEEEPNDNNGEGDDDDGVSNHDDEMSVGIIEQQMIGDNNHQDVNDQEQPVNPLVMEGNEGRSLNVSSDGGSAPTANAEWNNTPLQQTVNVMSIHQLLSAPPSSPPMIGAYINPTAMDRSKAVHGVNPNHQRITYLLLSLANSEEKPLIRADIPWNFIISCGSSFLNPAITAPTNYHNNSNDTHFSLLQSNLLEASPHLQPKPSLLSTLYQQLRDPNGARLMQGVLRMDPPLDAVKVLLDAFPLACLDMEGFFTACQFVNPNTSRRMRVDHGGVCSRGGPRLFRSHDAVLAVDEDGDDSDPETDDVGEVVKLVMHQTISARRLNSIDWGMVAFLGDARISPSQAKLLLRHAPEALIDPKHGAFGVSPLDRMASGFFIHGETSAWVEKLRLALRVAAYVRSRQEEREEQDYDAPLPSLQLPRKKILLPKKFFSSDCTLLRRRESSNIDDNPDMKLPSSGQLFPVQAFCPYHELIRLLVSPDFQGNKFGQHGFLQTLKACTQSDPEAFLRPDNEGNLPIHIALGVECKTVLGIKGERKLIKYLLDLDRNMALCPEHETRLPLRLSIENAWPVYDLISDTALKCCDLPNSPQLKSEYKNDSLVRAYIASKMVLHQPLLHDALDGCYHPRFGIHGARQLIKNIISKVTHHHYQNQNTCGEQRKGFQLTHFVDTNGRTALHVALQSKWPVYDLIVQANPNSIEARDPTQCGFFPFQTAACAFTTLCYPNKNHDHTAKGANEMKAKMRPETKQKATILRSNATAIKKIAAAATENGKEAELEMSMLFELIRESPLCVTWRMSTDDNSKTQASDLKEKAQMGEAIKSPMDGNGHVLARQSKKRRRSSSV